MAKKVDDSVLDAALDALKNNCDMMTACAGEPATFYEGVEPAAWAASTAYSLGDVVRPTTRNGFNYECTTAGTSDASEPSWPTTPGNTVNDGTAVWTCRTARQLADATMGGADFTHADGDTSGRKTTVGQKAGVKISRDFLETHYLARGNVPVLVQALVMSEQARRSLSPEQLAAIEGYARIVSAPLEHIETSAGGSARCMLAAIHLPRR